MITMAASTAAPTPPQRSFNPTTVDIPSSTLRESTEAKSSVVYTDIDSFDSSTVLRKIPTRILPPSADTNAIAVVDPAVDDDDPDLNELPTDTNALTFLKEWDAFYDDFVKSSTYTLAHSSANSNLPSLADVYVRSTTTPQITSGHSQSLYQLLQVIEELEEVNDQLSQLFPAPTPPPFAYRPLKTLTTTRRTECATHPHSIAHRSTSLRVRPPLHQTLLQFPCSHRRHPQQPRASLLIVSHSNS